MGGRKAGTDPGSTEVCSDSVSCSARSGRRKDSRVLRRDIGENKGRQPADNLGFEPPGHTVLYCRMGERLSHTWFVLTKLLGFDDVKNYDGSWTEWGNK